MLYLLSLLFFLPVAEASLQNIEIKNLNLNYNSPYGSGELEKLSIGVSTKGQQTYPVEIFRRDHTFEVTSPFVNFEWLTPMPLFHEMKKAETESLSLKFGYSHHSLNAQALKLTLGSGQSMNLKNVVLNCEGESLNDDLTDRMKTDCMKKLRAKISYMNLPFKVMESIEAELPDEVEEDLDVPAEDFSLTINEGKFSSYLRIKLIIRAYLRVAGFVQYENAGKTAAIRVDSIRFGKLPVTNLVMNILRREIQNPSVKIDPPWIRIQLGPQ